MDYVREELLRQRKALEVLLGGAAPEPETEEEQAAAAQNDTLAPEMVRGSKRVLPERRDESHGMGRMYRLEPVKESRTVGGALEEAWMQTQELTEYVIGTEERQADVRAVSRAVQRDARRYDGGFSIY